MGHGSHTSPPVRQVWTPAKEAGNIEDIQSQSQMSVALLVRALYFQSRGWGVTLECQHVRLADNALECPFEDAWCVRQARRESFRHSLEKYA